MPNKENPYSNLPDNAFWRTAVSTLAPLEINSLWKPKHKIKKNHVIATAGSCFAQHIGRALKKRDYSWLDSEPAPSMLNAKQRIAFNYGVFSFRTGNIYTPALLKQWVTWSLDDTIIPDEIWTREDGRFIDPFRPNIEPNGFISPHELQLSRKTTLRAIKESLKKTDVFVFTLGLTEAWLNTKGDYIYPMCPGTIAGSFDSTQHVFKNYSYPEIRSALRDAMELIKTINPEIKFLLTVSPVPLTATASGQHVLNATYYSKSVLRAVAGDMVNARRDTDYFPSYEIISSFPFKGMFYQPNMRNVALGGVDFVMQSFFECLTGKKETTLQSEALSSGTNLPQPPIQVQQPDPDEEVCEEALLDSLRK